MILLGPTTTGKSALSAEVSRRLHGEIVTSDGMFHSSFFEHGTGKSDYRRLGVEGVHLMDILAPAADKLSNAEFLRLVNSTVPKIVKKGHMPIIEGCTVSFNRSLIEHLDKAPVTSFHSIIGIRWKDTKSLPERIYQRLSQDALKCVLRETEEILHLNLEDSYVVKEAIVYRQLIPYLRGKTSLSDAVAHIVSDSIATAERQLRKYLTLPHIVWIDRADESPSELAATLFELPVVKEELDRRFG